MQDRPRPGLADTQRDHAAALRDSGTDGAGPGTRGGIEPEPLQFVGGIEGVRVERLVPELVIELPTAPHLIQAVAGQYAELRAAGCTYASQRGRIRSGNRQSVSWLNLGELRSRPPEAAMKRRLGSGDQV